MILRRIATAITSQNWFQVTIEIFIVVIGIFLGLQVTEWNEGRQERIEELKYLTRLTAELDITISDNKNRIERGKNALNRLATSIEMIDSRSLNETNKQQFEMNFHGANFFSGVAVSDNVITEMISTGKISLIRSDEIRSKLIDYYGSISRAKNNSAAHFEQFLNSRSSINLQIKLSLDYLETSKILDDPDTILNNSMLRGDLKFMHEFRSVEIGNVDFFILKTQEVRDAISLYLSNGMTIDTEMEQTP